jgi:hypothetical protein
VKKIDLVQVAADCTDYYRDYATLMANRIPPERRGINESQEEAHRAWQAQVDFSRQTNALALERFGPKAFSLVQQLEALGVPRPSMFHFAHDSGPVSLYIATAGDLLSQGLLDQAKRLDPNVTWGAGFR